MQLTKMFAVTRGRQCLCMAGLVLQFLILFKCCPITVTITIPRRTANNVSDTVELMTLRAVGRSVTQCLAATEQWLCLEDQLLRFVDAVAQDNSTWQWGDYIFVEKLTGNKSEGRTEEQLNFSKTQAPRQRSLKTEGDSQHNESGIAAGLLQLAKTRSIRLQLPTSVGTLSKISAGISDAIDGLALQNIAPAETSPETEAAQADEGRKKKGKDKNMAMMGGMAMMAMVAQMFLGKVILIAGAAFVMAKIALLVSVLGSLKKGSTGNSVSTERIVVTGHGHGGGGGHSGYEHDEGWHRRMPHIYPVTGIISEELQPVKAYHHSPTPPPPSKASASHQNHRYYVNEINEAANEDIDDGYRRKQGQAGFL
ncbi:uncharacterized protein LOC120766632 [Bactrocera tryoni]|uniref:uncharacterized protein LOC120766632 n=1 Tax=Bactrocera tryoni TaxID=59916 RepID=UPI001A979498|nr:uncharacterized protein LOC120766632 [Bactrocera tryoni]